MRNEKTFGLAAFTLLLLFFVSGCAEDTEPAKMVFQSEDNTKTFTINEKLEFTVTFLVADSSLSIQPGNKVSGKIKEASGKWTEIPLTGIVYSMTTTIPGVESMLNGQEVGASLLYTKTGNTINSVTLAFISGPLATVAGSMMAGTYTKQ